jgi:hypothetical protein
VTTILAIPYCLSIVFQRGQGGCARTGGKRVKFPYDFPTGKYRRGGRYLKLRHITITACQSRRVQLIQRIVTRVSVKVRPLAQFPAVQRISGKPST